jgi:GNAT superfamily N-acetyltransferase
VATDRGRPVGYLLLAIQHNDKTGEPYGYFADIYIEPEYRGGTLARDLHYMGEDYLRQIGIRKATNWTHAHNPLGKKAQAKVGINLWGLMMVKHLRK